MELRLRRTEMAILVDDISDEISVYLPETANKVPGEACGILSSVVLLMQMGDQEFFDFIDKKEDEMISVLNAEEENN